MLQKMKKMKKVSGSNKELWRDIPELFNEYEISSLGRLRSKERFKTINLKNGKKTKRLMKSRLMKTFLDKDGYECIRICDRKRGNKSFKIHRLIANSFIDNPENKKTVNHKNLIKNQNNVENLEWATNLENNHHSYQHYGYIGKCFDKKYSDELIIKTIKIYNENKSVAKSCRKTGVNPSAFYSIKYNKTRKDLYGYFEQPV